MNNALKIPTEQLSPEDLMTPKALVERYPHLYRTDGALRWAIHNAANNGFDDFGVVRRIGGKSGKVFIVLPRLIALIDANQ